MIIADAKKQPMRIGRLRKILRAIISADLSFRGAFEKRDVGISFLFCGAPRLPRSGIALPRSDKVESSHPVILRSVRRTRRENLC